VAGTVTYLEEDELAWHCDRINEFPGRTILLSLITNCFQRSPPSGQQMSRENNRR